MTDFRRATSAIIVQSEHHVPIDRQSGFQKLIDIKGGGDLVHLMKKAFQNRNYREVDKRIRDVIPSFLYNGGMGRHIAIADLVRYRRGEKYWEKSGVAFDNKIFGDIEMDPCTSSSRDVCWDLNQRGPIGETPLHYCFLIGSKVHKELAKRFLIIFPKLAVDIYAKEEFYGESCLHMAIANEDPELTYLLIKNGANIHERAVGTMFMARDQVSSKSSSLEHEHFILNKKTNYSGFLYWGEYPLSFAARLEQTDCVRLLLEGGADVNIQDSNGNTVLHMMVIHEKMKMYDFFLHEGADCNIKNNEGLVPLTLAAKLGKKDMYEHILNNMRVKQWIYGNVFCAAYPLDDIDTIDKDGNINDHSALHEIVFGEEDCHLEMLDGVAIQLLKEKWKLFARAQFYRKFFLFFVYFIMFLTMCILRPGSDPDVTEKMVNGQLTNVSNNCYLRAKFTTDYIARYVLECLVLIGAMAYILEALCEVKRHNIKKVFLFSLKMAPSRALFLLSCICIILAVPARAACLPVYEDIFILIAILLTAPNFLEFFRCLKLTAPFVVMFYKMITGDILRFLTIYLIFVLGFSQAMFIVFLSYNGNKKPLARNQIESNAEMYKMSLGEFKDIYEELGQTNHNYVGKCF